MMTYGVNQRGGEQLASMHFPESASDSERGLLRALRNTGVSVFYQDEHLRLLWAENPPAGWSGVDRPGALDSDYLPAEVAAQIGAAKLKVLQSMAAQRIQISVPDAEGVRWFDLWIDADRDDDGGLAGVITTAVDITEQKRREQTLRALLREVSHRSKNLLAIIQSIASQTGRYASSVDGFLTRFRGRIQSLASSQDLVTSSNWRGADLHQLVVGQVARYSPQPQRAIRFDGERPWLNPNAAIHVGLALHELAVNSVSYGALAKARGFVTVLTRPAAGKDGKPALELTWLETIGGEDQPSLDSSLRERKFGSVALERVVPAAINGEATLSIAGGKLEYRLIIPAGNFEFE